MTAAVKLGETELFDDDAITDPDPELAPQDVEATRLVRLALNKLEEGAQVARKARGAANRLRNVCTPLPSKI